MRCGKCNEPTVLWIGSPKHPDKMYRLCMDCGAKNSFIRESASTGTTNSNEGPISQGINVRHLSNEKVGKYTYQKRFF